MPYLTGKSVPVGKKPSLCNISSSGLFYRLAVDTSLTRDPSSGEGCETVTLTVLPPPFQLSQMFPRQAVLLYQAIQEQSLYLNA